MVVAFAEFGQGLLADFFQQVQVIIEIAAFESLLADRRAIWGGTRD
jgi:hypothetical protein